MTNKYDLMSSIIENVNGILVSVIPTIGMDKNINGSIINLGPKFRHDIDYYYTEQYISMEVKALINKFEPRVRSVSVKSIDTEFKTGIFKLQVKLLLSRIDSTMSFEVCIDMYDNSIDIKKVDYE